MRLRISNEWIAWVHGVFYNLGVEGRDELWVVVLALLLVVLIPEGRKVRIRASSMRKRRTCARPPRLSIGRAKLEKIFQATLSGRSTERWQTRTKSLAEAGLVDR